MEVELSSVANESSLKGQFHHQGEVFSSKPINASKLTLPAHLLALSVIVKCSRCDTNLKGQK